MNQQHERFLERLEGSRHAMFVVAERLHAKGCTVTIPAIRKAPTAAQAAQFSDYADLLVIWADRPDLERFEVKHNCRNNFTSVADWPYPHIFVTSADSDARAGDSVEAYYVVSLDYRHACVIPGSTRPSWYPFLYLNPNTGNEEVAMCCPRELVQFVALP